LTLYPIQGCRAASGIVMPCVTQRRSPCLKSKRIEGIPASDGGEGLHPLILVLYLNS
jgi:hypothetical protein